LLGQIFSDSYTIATNYIAEKLNFDFSESHMLELDQSGKLTGNVKMSLGWDVIVKFRFAKGIHGKRMPKNLELH
jgi:hypothetical protein